MNGALRKIKEYGLGLKAGLKFYGVNSFLLFIPLIFALVGLMLFMFLAAHGYHISATSFVTQANAYLAEAGYEQRLVIPDFGTCILRTLEGLRLATFGAESIASLGIKDNDVVAKLTEIDAATKKDGGAYGTVGILLLILLFFAGGFVTAFFIKKHTHVPYGWKYTLVGIILKFIVFAAVIAGLSALIGLIPIAGGIISSIVIPITQALFALYRGYLVQRGLKRTLKMFRFVTFKDVLIYVSLTFIIDIGIVIAATIIGIPLYNYIVVPLAFTMPMLSYTNAYLDVYAEKYILEKTARIESEESTCDPA